MVQTWFVCHKTWYTTLFFINYCFEIDRIKKLDAKSRFLDFFSAVWALSRKNCLKLGLFAKKRGTQHYLVYVIVLKWLEL